MLLESLRRADSLSRGGLPPVACYCVWCRNLKNKAALACVGLLRQGEKSCSLSPPPPQSFITDANLATDSVNKHTVKYSTLRLQCIFWSSVWTSEQPPITFLYSRSSVYCAVRTDYFNTVGVNLKPLKGMQYSARKYSDFHINKRLYKPNSYCNDKIRSRYTPDDMCSCSVRARSFPPSRTSLRARVTSFPLYVIVQHCIIDDIMCFIAGLFFLLCVPCCCHSMGLSVDWCDVLTTRWLQRNCCESIWGIPHAG
jgi:hypothetical protein